MLFLVGSSLWWAAGGTVNNSFLEIDAELSAPQSAAGKLADDVALMEPEQATEEPVAEQVFEFTEQPAAATAQLAFESTEAPAAADAPPASPAAAGAMVPSIPERTEAADADFSTASGVAEESLTDAQDEQADAPSELPVPGNVQQNAASTATLLDELHRQSNPASTVSPDTLALEAASNPIGEPAAPSNLGQLFMVVVLLGVVLAVGLIMLTRRFR